MISAANKIAFTGHITMSKDRNEAYRAEKTARIMSANSPVLVCEDYSGNSHIFNGDDASYLFARHEAIKAEQADCYLLSPIEKTYKALQEIAKDLIDQYKIKQPKHLQFFVEQHGLEPCFNLPKNLRKMLPCRL